MLSRSVLSAVRRDLRLNRPEVPSPPGATFCAVMGSALANALAAQTGHWKPRGAAGTFGGLRAVCPPHRIIVTLSALRRGVLPDEGLANAEQ